MMKKRLLFLCSMGQNRSRTAAEMYKEQYETRYGGIVFRESLYTRKELLLDAEWADYIVIMRDYMQESVPSEFWMKIKKLNIMDVYGYNSNQLKAKIITEMHKIGL